METNKFMTATMRPLRSLLKPTVLLLLALLPFWTIGIPRATGQASDQIRSDTLTRVSHNGTLSAAEVGRLLAEVPNVESVLMSPDGTWVVYSVTRPSLATNERKTELLLQQLPQDLADLPAPITLPRGTIRDSIRFVPPDFGSLSLVLGPDAEDPKLSGKLIRYELASGAMTPIIPRESGASGGSSGVMPSGKEIAETYAWSPKGNFIAFVRLGRKGKEGGLDKRRGVPPGEWKKSEERMGSLFVLDMATGQVRQLAAGFNHIDVVYAVSWSPDESALVSMVSSTSRFSLEYSDLVVVSRINGTVRELVKRPGSDIAPVWSPDGRSIAFSTANGNVYYYEANRVYAIIAADGGAITTFPTSDLASASHLPGWWSEDGRRFYSAVTQDMTNRALIVDIATRKVTILPSPIGEMAYDHKRSISANRKRIAFVSESPTTPPELFVSELDSEGRYVGKPRQLTRLSPEFPLSKLVRSEIISWTSSDGKFTIHGILLTPTSALKNGRGNASLPTLVYYYGGPGGFSASFGNDGQRGAVIALAARGYAVLVPYTRGRDGYGEKFHAAIRDEKSRGKGPLGDAIAGVELLIKRGIADRDKLGVLGHSYGGYMTAYTITQTTRFKGAVIHEGATFSLMTNDYVGYERGTSRELKARDLFGVHDPFDPSEQKRMLAESPILNADRVKTPTLMQFGAQAYAEEGLSLFNALRRLNVPSALFVYDEGHRFSRPAAIADDLTRTAEWLDFWVRGIPFPNQERAAEYNEWRTDAGPNDKQPNVGRSPKN